MKNSNLVDEEQGGLLLGLGGSVSKIFRGLLLVVKRPPLDQNPISRMLPIITTMYV